MLATKIEQKKNEEGFTLIELLVVVIIIGILAAIAIPAFLNQRESAWRSAAESDVRNAAISMETYYTRSGSAYPLAAAGTVTMDNLDGNAPTWYIADDGTISTTSAATDFAQVAVSDGVSLIYTNVGNVSYTIEARHNQIDTGGTQVALYDSAAGGLQ